ncbi:winged helix-turn-helix transcriptional regulator [Alicyclobacillus curvatus]|nr:winged helix-turn-helix transcriptional regulator [Alicyclobacillus curvatus]
MATPASDPDSSHKHSQDAQAHPVQEYPVQECQGNVSQPHSTSDKSRNQSMVVTEDQEKLLYNATRIRILRALNSQPMTAKQVAQVLGASKGNVHYHVQRLYEAGLLQLVETRPNGGILEKYYQAKAALYTRFKRDDIPANDGPLCHHNEQKLNTTLTLSEPQFQQLHQELVNLFLRFEDLTLTCSDSTARDYFVEVTLSHQGDMRGDENPLDGQEE